MMSLRKKSVASLTFADAKAIRANGYSPVMLDPGTSSPQAGWGHYVLRPEHAEMPPVGYGDRDLSIVAGHLPLRVSPGDVDDGWQASKSTWLAGLQVAAFDRKTARLIDELVTSRLVWLDDVAAHVSPVRLDNHQHGSLRLFQLAPSEPAPLEWASTRSMVMPNDPAPAKRYLVDYMANGADILSSARQFVVTADRHGEPYRWTHSLLKVSRSELPVLSAVSARALLEDIQALLVANGGSLWC